MTNEALLRSKIKSSGYRIGFIAEKCGLSYQGFLNKSRGISEFRSDEIAVIKHLLNLTPEETEEIFFAMPVEKVSTL